MKFKLDLVSSIINVSMLLHNFVIDHEGSVVKRKLTEEERIKNWVELEKWLKWYESDGKDEHEDAVLGMASDSGADTPGMYGENTSRRRAYLVMLLRIRGLLRPQLLRKRTDIEILEDIPENVCERSGEGEDAVAGKSLENCGSLVVDDDYEVVNAFREEESSAVEEDISGAVTNQNEDMELGSDFDIAITIASFSRYLDA